MSSRDPDFERVSKQCREFEEIAKTCLWEGLILLVAVTGFCSLAYVTFLTWE